jgi:hypothetical protein
MKNINPTIASASIQRVVIEDQLTGDFMIAFNYDDEFSSTVEQFRKNSLKPWLAAHPRTDVVVRYIANDMLFAYEVIDAQ